MVRGTNKPLSTNPPQVRARIRRRAVPMASDVAMLANHQKPLEEWDLEELARGRPRDVEGFFRGRAPAWITPAVRTEAARRLKLEAHTILAGNLALAIKVIVDLMTDEMTDDKLRADCAKFIIEHVIGKARQAVDVDFSEGSKGFLAKALVTRNKVTGRLVDAHPVVDITSQEWSDDDDNPS